MLFGLTRGRSPWDDQELHIPAFAQSRGRVQRALETTLAYARGERVPRFFLHLYDDMVVRDEEGEELPDFAAARRLAGSSARRIACAEVLEGYLSLDHRIEIEDERGVVLDTITSRM